MKDKCSSTEGTTSTKPPGRNLRDQEPGGNLRCLKDGKQGRGLPKMRLESQVWVRFKVDLASHGKRV